MALQGGAAPLEFSDEILSQRVHIPHDEIRHNPSLERVAGPTVSGDYKVCTAGDAPEQARRVWSAVQEDCGPHATKFSSPGSAVVLGKAAPVPEPSVAPQ